MERAAVLAAGILLGACGGGGGYDSGSGSGSGGALTYTVGGTVSGLNGTLVLQNNGGDNLTIMSSGPFTFRAPIGYGSTYDVMVVSQPVGQSCAVTNGAGAYMGSSITNVTVTCR
jgi:hypothetical protein